MPDRAVRSLRSKAPRKIIDASTLKALATARTVAQSTAASSSLATAAPRGGGNASSEGDAASLTSLVFDHLHLRKDLRCVMDSVQLAVLFKTEAAAQSFYDLVQQWKDMLPQNKGKKRRPEEATDEDGMDVTGGNGGAATQGAGKAKREPHPLGPKKHFTVVACFGALEELASRATPDPSQTRAVQALQVLKGLGGPELDMAFSGFQSKYPKPMAGRTWLWVVTVSTFAPPEVKKALLDLVATTDSWDILVDLKCTF